LAKSADEDGKGAKPKTPATCQFHGREISDNFFDHASPSFRGAVRSRGLAGGANARCRWQM